MSHTSQRWGLDPSRPGEEIIVLAMVSQAFREREGVREAMKELAEKMLAHGPHDWLSRNFLDLDLPQLATERPFLKLLERLAPGTSRELLFKAVAGRSAVISAIYTDVDRACALLADLEGPWVERNRRQGYPISVVLSGLFEDAAKCCARAGLKPHTYLQTLGLRGRVDRVPKDGELEILAMCGHGMIAAGRVRHLAERIARGEMSAAEAAEEVAKPCVCGIVNRKRAERIFLSLAGPRVSTLATTERPKRRL